MFIATPATIPPTSIIGIADLHARLPVAVGEAATAAEVVVTVIVISVVEGTSPVEVCITVDVPVFVAVLDEDVDPATAKVAEYISR